MRAQRCKIGTRGGVHLFNSLRGNSTLQRLSMRYNAIISLEGAADASSRFGLRALDMSSNGLEEIPLEFIEALHCDGVSEFVIDSTPMIAASWPLRISEELIAAVRRFKKISLNVRA